MSLQFLESPYRSLMFDEIRTLGDPLMPINGAGFWENISPYALKLGKVIATNPDVQRAALELGQKGIEELVSSIRGRAQQQGIAKKKQTGSGVVRARINKILKGGYLREID